MVAKPSTWQAGPQLATDVVNEVVVEVEVVLFVEVVLVVVVVLEVVLVDVVDVVQGRVWMGQHPFA